MSMTPHPTPYIVNGFNNNNFFDKGNGTGYLFKIQMLPAYNAMAKNLT